MKNTNKLYILLFLVISILIVGVMIYDKPAIAYDNLKTNCKDDSLQIVIDSLQTEIFFLEDGLDTKEHRYEDIISEYEIGISYLKDYHPNAYKDFHRIIGMKERYTRELDRENKKRLKSHE